MAVKMKLPTCPVCNQSVTTDCVPKKVKGKTYHIACYDKMISEKYEQDEKQVNVYQELQEYICKLFNIDEVTSIIENQILKMGKELDKNGKNKYTPSGILYALRYHYEYCENDPKDPKVKGIGIVPYVYEEARDFYARCKAVEEQMKSLKKSEKDKMLNPKTRVVKIKIDEEEKNKDLINIDDL